MGDTVMPLSWDQISNSPVFQQMQPEQQTLAKQQYDSQMSGGPSGQQSAPQPAVNVSSWPDDMQQKLAKYPPNVQPLI
jgi:hypothetical protein